MPRKKGDRECLYFHHPELTMLILYSTCGLSVFFLSHYVTPSFFCTDTHSAGCGRLSLEKIVIGTEDEREDASTVSPRNVGFASLGDPGVL